MSAVPFLDLVAVNGAVEPELELAWKTVLAHGRYIGGPEVEQFENEFADYCAAAACVGVGNGTDALELILGALGIGPGDEVIVPANTFVATAEAVCAVGARPRFVDVRADTLLLDVDAVRAAANPATAAVIAVHLFGQMVDMAEITELASTLGIEVIEDACQAHGARFDGRPAGGLGTAAAFSFYPGKNLGALGDGGAVVTQDAGLADVVRRWANHGRSATDHHRHQLSGRNSRLDTLQAAALSIKLARLDADNAARRRVMARYVRQLPPGCQVVATQPAAQPVHHLAVIRVQDRASVTAALDENEIGWGIHYPVPCHRQPAFEHFAETLPIAESAAREILSLPISPTLADDEVDRVCEVLWKVLK